MSEKIIIGLTGNIATGKSIVLRMLQELGATVIDADKLVHRLMRQGTPVYEAIINEFGSNILDESREISRTKLGQIVFSNPDRLAKLESITHPSVRKVILKRIDEVATEVVAVEAIKLFESGLSELCNSNWVVVAPPESQLKRLVERRKMSPDRAKQRIKAQSSQQEKAKKADVIIDNSGALAKTWTVVKKQYISLTESPSDGSETALAEPEVVPDVPSMPETPAPAADVDTGDITIHRAKRNHLPDMVELVSAGTNGAVRPDISDMMEALFSRAYIIAMAGDQVVGMIGWQTENLVAGLQDFYVLRADLWSVVGQKMLEKVHEEIDNLSCEVALVFVLNQAGTKPIEFLKSQNYEVSESKNLIPDWQDAAVEWQPEDSVLLYKKIREQRIMVPM